MSGERFLRFGREGCVGVLDVDLGLAQTSVNSDLAVRCKLRGLKNVLVFLKSKYLLFNSRL